MTYANFYIECHPIHFSLCWQLVKNNLAMGTDGKTKVDGTVLFDHREMHLRVHSQPGETGKIMWD